MLLWQNHQSKEGGLPGQLSSNDRAIPNMHLSMRKHLTHTVYDSLNFKCSMFKQKKDQINEHGQVIQI